MEPVELPTIKELHDAMVHDGNIASLSPDTIDQLRRNVYILGVTVEGLLKILMEKEANGTRVS